ncbi:hypothetical protein J2Z84_004410 [Agrobacterium rubi]|nr:hypothetical protein [Agrobacterium rubi]
MTWRDNPPVSVRTLGEGTEQVRIKKGSELGSEPLMTSCPVMRGR